MKRSSIRMVWLVSLAVIGVVGLSAAAEPPGRSIEKPLVGVDFLEVLASTAGEPILAVNYPWVRHQRPSIEVRKIEDTADARKARPLFFRTEYMKGTNLVAMYRCEELSADLPATAESAKDKVTFTMVGRRNLLNKPSVVVRCRSEEPGPRYGVRAVFGLLDAWSVDSRKLFLQLPREDFAEPGRIEVVFYRDEDIVWTQTANWPGYPAEKQGSEGETAGEQPAAKEGEAAGEQPAAEQAPVQ